MKYIIDESEVRTYLKSESCIFKKNNEEYGGLSNMASNYPIYVNEIKIRTTEALYQACRFPLNPEIQKQIIDEPSPMKVKWISNSNKKISRPDWEDVKLKIMRWCINVKLAQNILTFGELLNQTGRKNIVENSSKDNFWGAIPNDDDSIYKGKNALGRLLMELRNKYHSKFWIDLLYVEPPSISNFLLYSKDVEVIDERLNYLHSLISYWKKNNQPFDFDPLRSCKFLEETQKSNKSNLGMLNSKSFQANLFNEK